VGYRYWNRSHRCSICSRRSYCSNSYHPWEQELAMACELATLDSRVGLTGWSNGILYDQCHPPHGCSSGFPWEIDSTWRSQAALFSSSHLRICSATGVAIAFVIPCHFEGGELISKGWVASSFVYIILGKPRNIFSVHLTSCEMVQTWGYDSLWISAHGRKVMQLW